MAMVRCMGSKQLIRRLLGAWILLAWAAVALWVLVVADTTWPSLMRIRSALGLNAIPQLGWASFIHPSQNMEDYRQLMHLPAAPGDSVDIQWRIGIIGIW